MESYYTYSFVFGLFENLKLWDLPILLCITMILFLLLYEYVIFIYHVTVKRYQDCFQVFTLMNSGAMNILVDMSCVFKQSSTGIYIMMKNLTHSCHLFICTHNFFLWIFFLSTFVIPIDIYLFHFIISLVRWWTEKPRGLHSMGSQMLDLTEHAHTHREGITLLCHY